MGKNKSKDADIGADLAHESTPEGPELNDELTAIESELHHARSALEEARAATEVAATAYRERQAAEAACLHAHDQVAERARQHYTAERLRLEEHLRSVQGELAALDSKLTPFGEPVTAPAESIAPAAPVWEASATWTPNVEVATVAEVETAAETEAEAPEAEVETIAEAAAEFAAAAEAESQDDAEAVPTVDVAPSPEAGSSDDGGVAYEDEWYQRMKRQSALEDAERSW